MSSDGEGRYARSVVSTVTVKHCGKTLSVLFIDSLLFGLMVGEPCWGRDCACHFLPILHHPHHYFPSEQMWSLPSDKAGKI